MRKSSRHRRPHRSRRLVRPRFGNGNRLDVQLGPEGLLWALCREERSERRLWGELLRLSGRSQRHAELRTPERCLQLRRYLPCGLRELRRHSERGLRGAVEYEQPLRHVHQRLPSGRWRGLLRARGRRPLVLAHMYPAEQGLQNGMRRHPDQPQGVRRRLPGLHGRERHGDMRKRRVQRRVQRSLLRSDVRSVSRLGVLVAGRLRQLRVREVRHGQRRRRVLAAVGMHRKRYELRRRRNRLRRLLAGVLRGDEMHHAAHGFGHWRQLHARHEHELREMRG